MVVQRSPVRASKPGPRTRAQVKDDSIMGTNNSSIVSKRSVERLYFPDEPHFFRYFVKKPQRRAPLINRGYWLRMKALDHVVRQFLETPCAKQKVVINLGCGYDPLPWQCLVRYPSSCCGVKFIDIDYKDLMIRKRDMVQGTKELFEVLSNVETRDDSSILLRSDQYVQLGCDLRDLEGLGQSLSTAIDIDNCTLLFTAEVSITYMTVDTSDALIQWASRLPEGAITIHPAIIVVANIGPARFCILEQLMPDGADHPFAQTMMAHFKKLQTPLGAVEKYPTTLAQHKRFESLGWSNISARSLWELWSSPDFLSSGDRSSLDHVEPFDEWEEFALFASHYILLTADNKTGSPHTNTTDSPPSQNPSLNAEILYSENSTAQGRRRFAASLPIRNPAQNGVRVGNFGGMGSNGRQASCDIYSSNNARNRPFDYFTSSAPSSRMCHTITDLGDAGALLVGGRTSPDKALVDCWVYHKWPRVWERVEDLPRPRYRHSAIKLSDGSVLISPGRADSQSIDSYFMIWNRKSGWKSCTWGTSEKPHSTYGSTFTVISATDDSVKSVLGCGLIAGGISEDGIVQQDIWEWEVQRSSYDQETYISFNRLSGLSNSNRYATIARFGAATVNHKDRTFVLGGVVKNDVLLSQYEVCSFASQRGHAEIKCPLALAATTSSPRPFFIGISVVSAKDSLVVMGGSAVCFSFGTFWNKGSFTINVTSPTTNGTHPELGKPKPLWKYEVTGSASLPGTSKLYQTPQSGSNYSNKISRVRIQSSEEFGRIVNEGKPVIIEGSNLGPCTEMWAPEYLKAKIGSDREVVVHEATTEHMDFQAKNFSYVTKAFSKFIDQASHGERLYLRALSSSKPSELPADITRDFPSIAADFRLPPELKLAIENAHSSPLRISGPVIMWLHYDVMANILCQIRGSKRLLVFPPSDVQHFQFEAGASSSSINVFDKLEEYAAGGAHYHEALLSPGDVLFLPPLWLHTAIPTSGLSVAVNIFFRNLQTGYAAGKDVYGNRDLHAYERGRQDIAKIAKSFDGLPVDVRGFYLQRLVQELDQKF